jgi:hypothetical protein
VIDRQSVYLVHCNGEREEEKSSVELLTYSQHFSKTALTRLATLPGERSPLWQSCTVLEYSIIGTVHRYIGKVLSSCIIAGYIPLCSVPDP